VPTEVKKVFVTAHEISPEWHVEMQAAFQKYTDNAVSKTVNFSHEAAKEDVANVYMLAYEKNLKGITIYRDRSREGQPMSTGQAAPQAAIVEKKPETKIQPRKRAKRTTGITERVNTGCGSLYVTINSDEDGLCEVFSTLVKPRLRFRPIGSRLPFDYSRFTVGSRPCIQHATRTYFMRGNKYFFDFGRHTGNIAQVGAARQLFH